MRKEIIFMLVLTIIINFIPYKSLAENNYDKELQEAIVNSKKLFNIGNEYDVFNQSILSDENNTVFYLSWSDKKQELGYINLAIGLDGNVLNYNIWKPFQNNPTSKEDKISREEGLKISKDFIKKVSPKFFDRIKYEEVQNPLNINSDSYAYNFIRVENSIPYYNNNIYVSVNTLTGEVENYSSNWESDLLFSNKSPKLDIKEAQQIYKDKIALELLYRSNNVYGLNLNDKERDMYLVYTPGNTRLNIDALTGDIVENNSFEYVFASMNDGMGAITEEINLSPEERAAIDEVAGLISKAEAEKIGRDILELDSDFILESSNINKDFRNDNYNWSLSFRRKDNNNFYFASISLNGKTKELVSLSRDINIEKNITKISQDKALELAKDYMKKFNLDKSQLVELKENTRPTWPLNSEDTNQDSYSFSFVRKLDKAYVESDGITVSLYNGKINYYNVNWTKADFQSQENIISTQEAHNILFDQIGMEVKYIGPKDKNKDKEAQLVYGLKANKPPILSAENGNILGYDGKTYRDQAIMEYSDIEDSYAKDKINSLAKYGIALPGNEFKPKDKIREKDFLSLLLKSIDFYYDIDGDTDNLYKILNYLDIVKKSEENPESWVTKENSIKYIIRALKYDKIADLENIFKDIFKDSEDIDQGLKGYIAIAYGMGIIEGNNGYLHPKTELTRENAANIIYNYLFFY